MSTHEPVCTTAVVKIKTASFEGQVRNCRPGRAVVGFPGRFPPTFALSDILELALSGGQLETTIRCAARVIQRFDADEERRYVLDFNAPSFPDTGHAPEQRERRAWMRVSPSDDARVPIALVPVASSGRERPKLARNGRLLDVSGGGLGVLLDDKIEGPLTGHEKVKISFSPPGTQASVTRECRIRTRWALEDGIRLGLQFTMIEDASLTFEPMWNCEGCGEKNLLETSHPHCCGCGTVRSAEAQLVDWGDLIPRSEHRFTGMDEDCPACGARWSEEAKFCGTCGSALGEPPY